MKEVSFTDLPINPSHAIAKDWMLITAGNAERGYNTMTASWGHLGSLWGTGGGMPTAVIYIRPQRYTKEFVDREPFFTLSFFPKALQSKLGYLGSHSGRDGDKVAHVGFTPVFEDECTYFAEASMVLVCRKLYHAPILESGFVDEAVRAQAYPKRDYHEMYIGQIVKTLVAE